MASMVPYNSEMESSYMEERATDLSWSSRLRRTAGGRPAIHLIQAPASLPVLASAQAKTKEGRNRLNTKEKY
jgi:hypothetical protein